MEKVQFAVLGCGHMGKRYATIINENTRAELTGIIDIKAKEALDISNFQVPYYSSLTQFLAKDADTNVVCIATPNGLHYAQAIECLHEQKNILVEKPIALKKTQAQDILYTARHNNCKVFTVMQNRYSPPAIWVKSIVNSGILGTIFLVQINCFWNRDERYYCEAGKEWRGTKAADGGVLYTQFSHFIDILYWLFGDIKNIHTRLKNFKHASTTEFADSGYASFDFTNSNAMGEINFSTAVWDSNMESSITIVAERGSVKIGGQYMNEIQHCHIKDYQYVAPAINNTACNHYGGYTGSAANHHFVIENIIHSMCNISCDLPNPQDSVAVIDIIERIYAAGN